MARACSLIIHYRKFFAA